jgi:predicted regulator of Ras-like GTPase activity (Roadblock/LC7/MglB family)
MAVLACGSMDPAQALADLTEISSQIRAAVLLDGDGTMLASTLEGERAERLAGAARDLLAAAEKEREGIVQMEAATLEGSVFAVREDGHVIAATTTAEPTVGLVFYDLKSALRAIADQRAEAPKPRARKRRNDAAA